MIRHVLALILMSALLIVPSVARSQSPPRETTARKLVFAVVLSRHGVRSPIHPPKAGYRWPAWGEAWSAGFLSAHGYVLAQHMGSFYADYFHEQGLEATCYPPRLFVWADFEQRTMETANAIMDGWCGANTVQLQHVREGNDVLFHPFPTIGATHVDAAASRAALDTAMGMPMNQLPNAYAPSFAALQALLNTRCVKTPCTPIAAEPGSIEMRDGIAQLRGAVDTASTAAENLYLEYAECHPEPASVASQLHTAMRLHALAFEINERNSYAAGVRGSNLLAHITALLDEKAARPHPFAQTPDIADDAAVLLVGHDTNLANLGGLLGLDWNLEPEYVKNDMPPASALVFELFRASNGAYSVQINFVAETPAQVRSIRPLRDPAKVYPLATLSLTDLEARGYAQAYMPFVEAAWPHGTSDQVGYPPMTDPIWARCM